MATSIVPDLSPSWDGLWFCRNLHARVYSQIHLLGISPGLDEWNDLETQNCILELETSHDIDPTRIVLAGFSIAVWVRLENGFLYQIDPAANQLVGQIKDATVHGRIACMFAESFFSTSDPFLAIYTTRGIL